MSGLITVCEHSMSMDHMIDWENTVILKVDTDYKDYVVSWFTNSNRM